MTEHKKILDFIRIMRGSFPDATIVYTHGACYSFYSILKAVFGAAKACSAGNHIVTKRGGRFYDIHGEYIKEDGELRDKVSPLSKSQHEYWESVVSGQRIEHMLKKYND